MTTGLVYDPVYREHLRGRRHLERPERLDAVLDGIRAVVPAESLLPISPRRATIADAALCHGSDYIRAALDDMTSGCGLLRTGDTDVSEGSLDAAMFAVGGVLAAVDVVIGGTVDNAFCAVRPPGHHATRDRGMGFCIFNNAAIGARYAQDRYGIERVLIADWDIHHGNGTQDIFYEDPSVFYFSTHQWPCYPGTGAAHEDGFGPGKGYTLNCPLAPGAGRREVLGAFREGLVHRMQAFRPELVIVSAGFDARQGDPIGTFTLRDDDFADLTRVVLDIAAAYSRGRLVSVLEGGYDLEGLATSCGTHVRELARAAGRGTAAG